ncbi:MAG: sulfite exporter TauE/SafE family protein [Frankiaceae bacterium]
MKRRLLLFAGLVPALLLLFAGNASAHPLGNFTVNQYSGLVVTGSALRVDYVVDMAEIPTFQAKAAIDRNSDGRLAPTEVSAYAAAQCTRLAGGLRAAAEGRPLPLRVERSAGTLPPGQAGLPTLRLHCAMTAPLRLPGHTAVSYRDDNFAGRVGWREITAAGDRTTLTASDVPVRSISSELTAYPKNLTSAPLDVRGAALTAAPGGPPLAGTVDDRGAASPLPRGVDRATTAFLGFVNRANLGPGLALAALLLALALGGLHALAPGHGKTVMAAYLVGRRGSLRTAATIGATVTITHTAGVLVLGVALSLSTALAPERLLPILGLLSGLLLAVIGAGLLRSALHRQAHGHSHGPQGHIHDDGTHHHGEAENHAHPEEHTHPENHAHPEEHTHPENHAHRAAEPAPRRRSLIAMGFAGGLVPSPSALVVLLSAIAFHRAWFGVLLVTAYGLGMAAMLTLAGLLLVRARELLDRRGHRAGRFTAVLSRTLPVGTAGLITLIGLGLAVRGASVVLS